MTKLVVVLLACTACASAPATTASTPTPVVSVSGPVLTGAAKWADSAGRLIDQATFAGSLQGLRNASLVLDQGLAAYPNDALLLQYQGYELYREAGLLGIDTSTRKAELPRVASTARIKLLESLAAQPLAETHALLAMTMGRMIGLDQIYSPTLGPLIPKEMAAAVAMGPNNPRVWLLRGIQSFYTSVEYGGGLPVAETQLNKAIELFATDNPAPPAPFWGKAEAYVWLGQVLQKQNRIAEARAAYNNALLVQPNYPWVIYSLLPSIEGR
ncbi:MAG: tetratricopeptide repeat protein [Gemmatimonadota bacterium]|nr:tetratricopeptide repeat protein [Gemmatimonadota bacterium]